MRTILLCAGRGSRLLPFTMDHPKCLVEVDGKTILDHQIDALRSAGVGPVTIVGGYRVEQIEEHLALYLAAGRPELIVNPFWSTTSSIASLWFARHRLEDAFCIANGDVIFPPAILNQGLSRMEDGINLLVERAPAHLDDMRVEVDEGRIVAVGKTLDPAAAVYRSLGILLCRSGGERYRSLLERAILEDGGPALFHHEVVHRLAMQERVNPIEVTDRWIEIDSPLDIEAYRRNDVGKGGSGISTA